MGLLAGLFEKRATAGGSFHVSQSPPGWIDRWSSWGTAAGVSVNESNALQVAAVYACVRVLAETLASLPLPLYRRGAGGQKTRAPDHYLYSLLHDAPNPELTSFEFRETMQGHLGLWGNAYSEIEIDGAGRARALWPLRPDKMSVSRQNGALTYEYRLPKPDASGRTVAILPAERVLHIRGLGFDGIRGYSPIELTQQAIGLAMATEEFGARFFGNGARPGVVLAHPGHLSDEAYDRLKESWEQRHQGLSSAHRVAILEEGITLTEVGIPPEAAQFLATRKFQVAEIARIFRVPPHMIQDLERATFSNIEHQSIDFVVHTIRPWLVRWEQAINMRLLLAAERRQYFAEFLVDGLLRGDTASRYSAYAVGRQNGWLSANDIRQMENMNGIPGGDLYWMPLNVQAAGTSAPSSGPADRGRLIESRAAGVGRYRLMNAWRPVLADAAGRVVRRQCNDIGNAAARFAKANNPGEFSLWLDTFFAEQQRYTAAQFKPVLFSYADLVAAEVAAEVGSRAGALGEARDLPEGSEPWAQRYTEALAQRHATMDAARIREIVNRSIADREDWLVALEAEFADWRENRPDQIAGQESVRFNNALAVHLYTLAGILRLRWVAFGESCPYCSALNGRVVGITKFFLLEGESFEPDGAERPLQVSSGIRHAPAHRGCDCMVVAAP